MAYFTLVLIFAAMWFAIFLLRADLRRALLLVSLAITPLGPISELWFLRDYWVRDTLTGAPIGLEDLLFGFFLGGVTFAIYKVFFRARVSKNNKSVPLLYIPLFAAVVTVSALLILTDLLKINSIFSSSLGFCITAGIIWHRRPDLVSPSLVSGFLSVAFFIFAYTTIEFLFPGTIVSWCLHCNPTQFRVLGINVEELIWDFAWGLVGGVIFEAATGRHILGKGSS
jgi:hypothetical protein